MYSIYLVMLMLVIFYQMSMKAPLFNVGVFGSMMVVVAAQFSAMVKMKRTVAEITIADGAYSLRTVYDVAFDQMVPMQPLGLSNAKLEGDRMLIQFDNSIKQLDKADWNDYAEIWGDLKYQ
ncbi:hypothetical protein JYU23_00070 [bacterium AH-315-C07]|nr:hypothetical protein [bacterium AH-315-C07]